MATTRQLQLVIFHEDRTRLCMCWAKWGCADKSPSWLKGRRAVSQPREGCPMLAGFEWTVAH